MSERHGFRVSSGHVLRLGTLGNRQSPITRSAGPVLMFAAAGGAIVGLAWGTYVLFGLINWYPVTFHAPPDSAPSPLIAIPFLGIVSGGATLAAWPLTRAIFRVVVIAYVVHALVSFVVYALVPATWFETQTPAHVLFFGVGALVTLLLCVDASPLRLVAAVVGVSAMAMVIDAVFVAGRNIDPDLYAGIVIAIAIAFWSALAMAAVTSSRRRVEPR